MLRRTATEDRRQLLRAFTSLAAIAAWAGAAHAQIVPTDRGYVGPAFIQLDGIRGAAKEPRYERWVRVDSHYWQSLTSSRPGSRDVGRPPDLAKPSAGQAVQVGGSYAQATQRRQAPDMSRMRGRQMFTLPVAPRSGGGKLNLAIAKGNPALAGFLQHCKNGTPVPEALFSVSSDRSRAVLESGPRPSELPDFLDLRLKNVSVSACPTVPEAPEQALILTFDGIEWLNWTPQDPALPVRFTPAALPAAHPLTGESRAWVITWIAVAHDVSDDQCPKMHERPSEADYYALMPPDEAALERQNLASKGGPNYENGQMGFRGPQRLNVTMLPGIVPDPGLPEPQTRIGRGLDLDRGKGPKHKEYVSSDGKITGIDNQLYTVEGCIAGWQGHKGFIMQFNNNQMRDGQLSLMLELSGIDDYKNDDEVYLTWYYSTDAMAKSASGKSILADYTFNISDSPELSYYQTRFRARIVDGVIETERKPTFSFTMGRFGNETTLFDAGLRLELTAQGGLLGVMGGYRDWREVASTNISSSAEFYHGFQQPALYNSLKRNADGLRNSVTGEYDGISTAYDIEAVPAFVAPPSAKDCDKPASHAGKRCAAIESGATRAWRPTEQDNGGFLKKAGVRFGAAGLLLAFGVTAVAQEQPATRVFQPDGSIQVPAFTLPPSTYLSPEALEAQKSRATAAMPDRGGPTIEAQRAAMEKHLAPSVAEFLARYPVDVVEQKVAGIPTRIFTPKGAAVDPKRILINLHGGAFSICAIACAFTESVPVAAVGKFKVISVDYRQGPEHVFPAASEDVAAVYRELLKTYKPKQIGIYGCSAGGVLTAQVAAWLPAKGLPQAGAVGIFGSGAVRGGRGDSNNLAIVFDGPPPRPATGAPVARLRTYFEGSNPADPLVNPGNDPATLANFPPTLLITGTRAGDMTPAIVTHSRLLKAGVDSNLIVGEGMGHCYQTLPKLPEAHDAINEIVKFFKSRLG